MANFKLELIDDVNRAHHFASIQWSSVLAVLFVVAPIMAEHWPEIAPVLLQLFPSNGRQWVPVIGLVIVMIARVIKKVPKDAAPETPQ